MKNPYESLGVGKDATSEQIKSAYRRKAKKTHPDKGGNTAEFQEVSKAYALLSDPAKRDYYDRTGTEEKSNDNVILQELAALFLNIIDNVPDVTIVNITAEMEKAIKYGIAQRHSMKAQATSDIKKRETALGRVSHGDKPDNVLADILKSDIAQRKQKMSQLDADIERGNKLLEVLSEYQYRVDEMRVFVPSGFSTSTRTTSFL